ncbi:hypothetical protein E2C01_083498 [Portunus trituberculatus]|uniref:Uncharacterized protein n=1 Tax=Portunus trituberculatus TaxID=210409 RepID=A0A5B7J864_PORTR|nr:hypothetical protein [Portunus trituberculatus]
MNSICVAMNGVRVALNSARVTSMLNVTS